MTLPTLVPPTSAHGYGDAAVTPHRLATQAAVETMAAGGTAVDGAVAANAVLGVVAPETCGVGGDLFALVHRPGDEAPAALNASGRAGAGADPDELRRDGHSAIPLDHPLTVTVPGCVAGWAALLERFGRMGFADVLTPARRLAEDGFPASDELCRALQRRRAELASQPSARALYPSGDPPQPGDRLQRPDLAATLREIAAGGRGAFYEGAPGAAITAATGGRITPGDLAGMSADWVPPLGTLVSARSAWTIPPNSQGYLTLAAAWLFDQLDPPPRGFDAEYVHLLVECYRAVAWERDELVCDPDQAPLAPAELLSPERLEPRLEQIRRNRAVTWPAPAPAPGGTAYLCTLDRDGTGVSLIQSNFHGIGSGIGAGKAGFFLHNRGAGFVLDAGHPNELAVGKRPLHTLSPTLWSRNGEVELLLGTRGAHFQPQLLVQVAAHLLRLEASLPAAQALPRFTLDEFGPGANSRVAVEGRMPPAVIDGLRQRGHEVVVAADFEEGWGPVSVIHRDRHGLSTAAADPRVATTSAAVR